jgi:hypothetical protein
VQRLPWRFPARARAPHALTRRSLRRPARSAPAAAPAAPYEEAAESDDDEGSPTAAVEEDEDASADADAEEESFEASILMREATARSAATRAAAAAQRAAPSSEWSAPTERARWSKVKKALRPTQAALGYDWCFYKLQQFTSEAAAQRYMDSKPVPYVQRGSKKYIVDHHHTLAALELSGFDVDITLEQVRSFDKTEQTLEGFWGYLEGRGWAFLRDENYNRIPIVKLPKARRMRMVACHGMS